MSEDEEFSKYATIQKCPACGGEIAKGYATAIRGVLWDDRKRNRHFLWAWSLGLVVPFYSQNVPALKCKNCDLIILKYEDKHAETPEAYFKKCVECNRKIPVASDYCPLCGAKQRKVKP
jgi:rRNA maturation endonuclease Nob1